MAASGTCLQVLTASLRRSQRASTLESLSGGNRRGKRTNVELIADIFGLNKHVAAIIMSFSSSTMFNGKNIHIYFGKLRKVCLETFGRCEISTHDKFPSYFYNE